VVEQVARLEAREDSREKRRIWLEWFLKRFPSLAQRLFGAKSNSPEGVRIALPEQWQPTAEELSEARKALKRRRAATRWRTWGNAQLREALRAAKSGYCAAVDQVEERASGLRDLVGSELLQELPTIKKPTFAVLDESRLRWFERDVLFDPNLRILAIESDDDKPPELRYLSTKAKPEWRLLSGKSAVIHKSNETHPVDLSADGAAEDYLRFFCHHVASEDGGYFLIVEDVDEIISVEQNATLAREDAESVLRSTSQERDVFEKFRIELQERILPITRLKPLEGDPKIRFCATVFYGGALFHCGFGVSTNGMVEMIGDINVVLFAYPEDNLPLQALRRYPDLQKYLQVDVDANGDDQ